jgi:hypothetical protein
VCVCRAAVANVCYYGLLNATFFPRRNCSFLNEVEEAEDGFDVVAGMFSKGLFGPQQLGERG